MRPRRGLSTTGLMLMMVCRVGNDLGDARLRLSRSTKVVEGVRQCGDRHQPLATHLLQARHNDAVRKLLAHLP